MAKLSKRTVDALQPRDKDYFEWDDELPGFGIRVWPKGRKVYLIQYRDSGGRTRRKTLGKHGVVTAEETRKYARELLSGVARGQNPSEDARRKRTAPTVAELCERFMSEYVPSHCKASTQKEYRRNVDLFIKPRIGAMKVADVERSDIADLHHAHRDIPYQANRTLGVLSVMFNQAEVWGLRPEGTNPCRHVKKYEEKKRERYLSPAEFSRLGQTLSELEASGEESSSALNAIRLLILTGCRLGEIQTLKWEYVQGNRLRLPDSKTGAKTIYLSNAALDVLSSIEKLTDNPYVITGKKPGAHLTDLQHPWRRVRARAGLDDVRIHDLRHSFGASAARMNEGVLMIGKLLGHSQLQTTARYAHLADDPIESAAARVSGQVATWLSGSDST
ncbi:tyrosine-type recombinase/integrase [Hwanghaeella sp.]|uniref:tyrosine-type recombinase/integrase n=1 Tax=Hwanghaeella sp. TaxID=2605943 RepID=UPI003CCC089C